jgi:SAM-dependent methyltransferase
LLCNVTDASSGEKSVSTKHLTPWEDIEAERRRDEARFRHFIPNWLAPRLHREHEILSIGCGSGRDVEMLREIGFHAHGFDPGRMEFFKDRSAEAQKYLTAGKPGEKPFGDKRFDYVYALEVIEHVGCYNGGTTIEDDFMEHRDEFIWDSISLLKPGGVFLITSTNRLCPIDLGHAHRYHVVGRIAHSLLGLGLTWPSHPKNPLWSVGDIRRSLTRLGILEHCTIERVPVANYPRTASSNSLKGRIAKKALELVSHPWLLAGPFCPIIAVEIRTDSAIFDSPASRDRC